MVLRQAEDPKFSLYGELPSPAAPSSGVALHAGLGPLGPLGMPAPFHPGLALPFMPHGGLPNGAGLPPFGLAGGSSMGPGVLSHTTAQHEAYHPPCCAFAACCHRFPLQRKPC